MLMIMVVLFCYAVRHIYRLLTEQLLSTNGNLSAEEMNTVMGLRRPFEEMGRESNTVESCSICLVEFDEEGDAIMLPGCKHCFHEECIRNWLENKATCPYCRNNIRLSLI